MRLPLKELAQSGATDGQFCKWDNTTKLWVPASISPSATAPEQQDMKPYPESQCGSNSTRGSNTVFDGASYLLHRQTIFNRLVYRLSGLVVGTIVRILIYQTDDGTSGGSGNLPKLRASFTGLVPAATGNQVVTPTEGTVTLQQGVIYVLYGKENATTATFRTYTTQADDLDDTNVDLDTHPTSFTTAISALTAPATIDPRQSPTGQLTGTSSDVTAQIRLKKV